LPEAFSNLNPTALLLGIITLFVVYFTPSKINKFLPAPLLALVIGTALLLLVFQDKGITILGAIPTGLPEFRLPQIELSILPTMIKSALILALLGTIDSLLTSLVADNITNTYHKSNRELVGQGIGNTLAGLFGGLPGAGATMRTVVNVRAGGLTPISGALHALVLLSIVLGLGGVAKFIPHVVLAGILIKVGTDIIDWDYLKRLHKTGHAGIVIMFTVLFTTVFVDLIIAVAIGMTMAAIMLLKRQTDLQLSKMNIVRGIDEASPLSEQGQQIMDDADGQILLYHIGGPVSFGAAKEMQRMQSFQKNYAVLVLDLHDVPALDYTASCAIKDIIKNAQSTDRKVLVIMPHSGPAKILEREQALESVSSEFKHSQRIDALQHAQTLL
ncbi:MAG: SulP family inorganic anion transporter, partial [Arenicellales bacterium]